MNLFLMIYFLIPNLTLASQLTEYSKTTSKIKNEKIVSWSKKNQPPILQKVYNNQGHVINEKIDADQDGFFEKITTFDMKNKSSVEKIFFKSKKTILQARTRQ